MYIFYICRYISIVREYELMSHIGKRRACRASRRRRRRRCRHSHRAS